MGARAARSFAWSLCGLSILLAVTGAVLAVGGRPSQADLDYGVACFAVFLAFTVVGAVIAARHPESAIGWLLLASGGPSLRGRTQAATSLDAFAAAADATADPHELWLSTFTLIELIEAASRSGRAERAAEALGLLSESTRASGTPWGLGVGSPLESAPGPRGVRGGALP